jgi:hypothetical protein
VFNLLITPFIFVFDAGFCKAMGNVTAWFEKIARLPFVARNAGYVKTHSKPAGVVAAAPAGKTKGGK